MTRAAPLEAVLIGAGLRGRLVYGGWARAHPGRLRLVGVAEPDAARRETVAAEHAIPRGAVASDWRDLLVRPRLAPLAIVATGDALHVEPALAALAAGHHVLLEKPIAPAAADCVRVVEAAERAGRVLQIAHVLRYTPFYAKVHEIVAGGRLGRLVHLDLREHVAYWHMAHSYVRGKFRNRRIAAPFLLAKSCHDLDLLVWFAGRPVARVASFGGLSVYAAANAPRGAPERCSDGCPVQEQCPHDAVRFYAGPAPEIAGLWPWSDVSPDPSREARQRALRTGPYGRCVYRCDNDVVDHQLVQVEFEDGVTGSFSVHGHGAHESRTLRLTGDRGELRGWLERGRIEVERHGRLAAERYEVGGSPLGHFGGDEGLLDRVTRHVAAREADPEAPDVPGGDGAAVSGRIALESHLLGFAAERARERGGVVEMAAFREAVRRVTA